MTLPHLARRLACASALIMFGAIGVSVMTHDAWLTAGHVAGLVSALVAAAAVLSVVVAGLRRVAGAGPPCSPNEAGLASHEPGLTRLEATDPARPLASDEPSNP
ncbi:hypothetical protein [Caulobacter segnis]|uniref:hypothetical protein n=1 Tax=Caulobacter segnis TaxID=88688 RepID=UPI00285B0290|nr:hypothetical protein [Caulobacter segnis]MDR6625576.1 hypothetical protein [Caulobacter segnis]